MSVYKATTYTVTTDHATYEVHQLAVFYEVRALIF